MLKFIYATDLHGMVYRYESILDFAVIQGIPLIHIGADLLPPTYGNLDSQKNFIKKYLSVYFERARRKGIRILCSFGNDDFYSLKNLFRSSTKSDLLDDGPVCIEGYTFYSYNFVPDYPFGLKTACKMDYPGWRLDEEYRSVPVDIYDGVVTPIKDIEDYFNKKGSIKEDLEKLTIEEKSIVSFHCPPAFIDLDICANRKRVGSTAIFEWIKKNRPLLVLCGHIHESPVMSGGIWKVPLNKTIIIQPGQVGQGVTIVVIEMGESPIYRRVQLK